MEFYKIVKKVQRIYTHLADVESRQVFMCRLMYSLTLDDIYIHKLVETLPEFMELKNTINSRKKNYIFGAGSYGNTILFSTKGEWYGILDNNRNLWGKHIDDSCLLPLAWKYNESINMMANTGEDYLQISNPKDIKIEPDEMFYIAARKPGKNYQEQIIGQLKSMGCQDKQMVCLDELIAKIEDRQYFDCDVLGNIPSGTFIDVGAFDGNTALRFAKKAVYFNHIYCFEPDIENWSVV